MQWKSAGIACFCLLLVILLPTPTEGRDIGIGIYLMNAFQIDTLNGLWVAEAMIYFYDNDNATMISRTPYIANMGGLPSVITVLPAVGATNVLQRLVFKPDPSLYPFDVQTVELSIEDYNASPESDLNYYWLESHSGVSPDLRLRGWKWDASSTGKGEARTRTYFGSHKVSQFTWRFPFRRAPVVAVQVLLPPFFVLVSVLISFIMPITASITRIGVVGSALISEVSLHSGIKNANGTAGSLGLIDWFFILTYGILVISLGINVLVMILLRKNSKSPLAIYLESRAKYFVWMVCPGLYTFIFFRGKLVWAAFICLLTPLILYTLIDRFLPYLRAWRRSVTATQKKLKEDAMFEDEVAARMQEGEVCEMGDVDSRRNVVNREIRNKVGLPPPATENSDSIDLYGTDSDVLKQSREATMAIQ